VRVVTRVTLHQFDEPCGTDAKRRWDCGEAGDCSGAVSEGTKFQHLDSLVESPVGARVTE
jgi:hypothetical protein